MGMKSFFSIAALLLVAGAIAAGPKWLTSYDEAVKQSKKTGKPILADFTGSDWCPPCIRLHKDVFSKPEFMKWAEKNVVLLELDFPRRTKQDAKLSKQNEALASKYEIQGFPTVLILNSAGKVLGTSGFTPGSTPSSWIGEIKPFLAKK
jgi:protein disulfide-isomerase